jgi:hypothetical protein
VFYRWRAPNNILMMTDLANAYLGEDLFILGGHPSLRDAPLESLGSPGVMTMALNNVPYVFPNPTFWLTADKPTCYGSHFFHRPDIIKFARLDMGREATLDTDKVLKDLPNMFFYELNGERYHTGNFLTEGVDVVWWNSVFPISLQLAWRLGFRRVFLVGCGFWNTLKDPYAWPVKLTEKAKTLNQLTYNGDIAKLESLLPHMKAMGFKVYSCTVNSRANELIEFLPVEEAVAEVISYMPKPTPLDKLHHSNRV